MGSQEVRATSGGKPRDLRDRNLRVMIRLFREKGILSIQEAANLTGLSRTTAAKLISYLAGREILLAVGKGPSTDEGGKKPELYCYHGGFGYAISTFLTQDGVTGVLYDLNCDRLADHRLSPGGGYEETMEALAELVGLLLKKTGVAPDKLAGIAVGCEGIVDAEEGVLQHPSRTDWAPGRPVRADLARRLAFPAAIHVDNICRFFGYAENSIARPREEGCLATIYTDRRTGGCIIRDDRLLRGANGFIGELGHIALEMETGPKCHCGSIGCFEALVSPQQVIAYAEGVADRYPESPLHSWTIWSLEDFFTAANEGDAFARDVVYRVAGYFAAIIHTITLLHDPRQVVIQGVYADGGVYLLQAIAGLLAAYGFYSVRSAPEVRYSALRFSPDNPDNLALGGALYVADDYLERFLRD